MNKELYIKMVINEFLNKMKKEKYKQLCLFLQFGGIRTMEHTHALAFIKKTRN